MWDGEADGLIYRSEPKETKVSYKQLVLVPFVSFCAISVQETLENWAATKSQFTTFHQALA